MSDLAVESRTDRRPWILLIACAVLFACAVVRSAHSIAQYNSLNFVSGAWVALAQDLSEGIFYRPLVSDDGFGGTRFFPLQFVCHAVLIRFGLSPFTAGFVLCVTWTILLLTGIYAFLRRAGASVVLSAGGALVPLASASMLMGLIDIRGDILPAALNVWGLAMCLPCKKEQRPSTFTAAVLFSLAFAAKITTVFGVAAGFIALIAAGNKKAAFKLATLTAIGYAITLGLIYMISGGRVVEIFRACAAGGTDLKYLIQSPIWLTNHFIGHDPIGFALFVAAIGGVLGMIGTVWRDLPSIAMVTTLAIALLIFGSPGTGHNHLIDIVVMSAIFLVVQIVRGRVAPGFVIGGLSVLVLIAAMYELDRFRDTTYLSRKSEMAKVANSIGSVSGPILAEDPLIPLMAGQRPYVLDSWMLRLITANDPAVMQRLQHELDARKFPVVVLNTDPARDGGRYLEERVFGKGFVASLLANYDLSETVGRFKLYRPKTTSDK